MDKSNWNHEVERLNRLSAQLEQQARSARLQAEALRASFPAPVVVEDEVVKKNDVQEVVKEQVKEIVSSRSLSPPPEEIEQVKEEKVSERPIALLPKVNALLGKNRMSRSGKLFDFSKVNTPTPTQKEVTEVSALPQPIQRKAKSNLLGSFSPLKETVVKFEEEKKVPLVKGEKKEEDNKVHAEVDTGNVKGTKVDYNDTLKRRVATSSILYKSSPVRPTQATIKQKEIVKPVDVTKEIKAAPLVQRTGSTSLLFKPITSESQALREAKYKKVVLGKDPQLWSEIVANSNSEGGPRVSKSTKTLVVPFIQVEDIGDGKVTKVTGFSESTSHPTGESKRAPSPPQRAEHDVFVDYSDAIGKTAIEWHDERLESIKDGDVLVENVEWDVEFAVGNDKRLGKIVVSRSVDRERDMHVGVPLSYFNLNYVFEDPKESNARCEAFGDVFLKIDTNYLPHAVDLRSKVKVVLNQGQLGSVTACAVASVICSAHNFVPSRLALYYGARASKDLDTGATLIDTFQSALMDGVCEEKEWAYIVRRFDEEIGAKLRVVPFDFYRVAQRADQVKKCLKDGYFVAFGVALFESFMDHDVAQTGVVKVPHYMEKRIGGHVMTIVGYDDSQSHYICLNSWGVEWGDSGFCYVPYAYIMDPRWCGDFYTARV